MALKTIESCNAGLKPVRVYTYYNTAIMTADVTAAQMGTISTAGEIIDVLLTVGTLGVDADEATTIEVDVLVSATSVLTTKAQIKSDDNEYTGVQTLRVGGTDVTAAVSKKVNPVLKTDGTEDVAVGAPLTVTLDGTVTGNGTWPTNICVTVVIADKVAT